MLDDDIVMPCADIERGFAIWRHRPERVTGFYSRILEGDPPQYQCIKVCVATDREDHDRMICPQVTRDPEACCVDERHDGKILDGS